MAYTNFGRTQAANLLGSAVPFITYMAIGSGSGVPVATDTTMYAELARFAITGSPDFSTAQKISFTADQNSVQMSGIKLTELGLYASGAALTGSIWAHEAFPAVTFDGSNELRVVWSLQVT